MIKVVKVYQRKKPLVGLRPETLVFLDEHMLPSNWYAHELLLDLLQFTYKHILQESEERALQMGIAGGKVALTTFHKAFLKPGDPMASALAMRHLWNTYFDFAALHTETPSAHAVRFTVTDYQDVPAVHAMTIAGWHVASAELGGASKVTCEWLERPWRGDTQLSYIVKF